MKTQKIINLLNDSDDESSKFATRKWYIINDQNNGQYGEGNENDSTIKFEKKVIKSNLCDYSDAYILVTGNITAARDNANTKVAFKNCASFRRCVAHINDEHVETAENLDIIMPMTNLLEYNDNYVDSSGSLSKFRRDEQNMTDAGNPADVTVVDSSSFKYKSNLLENPVNAGTGAGANAHALLRDAKIAVPLKYLSNYFRSLEMPLINCKIHIELSWTNNCVMSAIVGATSFKIASTNVYVSIVTLSTKDNVNLTKQLNEGFKISVYWNEYKSKIETEEADADNPIRFPLDPSFQGANRLSVLAFNSDGANRVQRNSHRKCFLPRVDITKYNELIDGRDFYDQPTFRTFMIRLL